MGTLILIKCTNFYPYLMAMYVRTEGDKFVFSSAKFETFANLVWVKATYHHYFHLKTNMQKLEKDHVNGSLTRRDSGYLKRGTHNHNILFTTVPFSQKMTLISSWPVAEGTWFEGMFRFEVLSDAEPFTESFNVSFGETVTSFMVRVPLVSHLQYSSKRLDLKFEVNSWVVEKNNYTESPGCATVKPEDQWSCKRSPDILSK